MSKPRSAAVLVSALVFVAVLAAVAVLVNGLVRYGGGGIPATGDPVPTQSRDPESTPSAVSEPPSTTGARPSGVPTGDGAGPTAVPTEGVGPTAVPTGSANTLDDFLAACASGLPSSWREGQVDYPKSIRVAVGRATVYEAAIDIRDVPPPPGEVILGADISAGSEKVAVQCRLAARLRPVGTALIVDPPADEWQDREFSPLGLVEWTWSVTATELIDQQIVLSIQPAVTVVDLAAGRTSVYAAGGTSEVSVATDVYVDGTFLQRVNHWLQTEGMLAGAIAVVLVGALLWILTKVVDVRRLASKASQYDVRDEPDAKGRPKDDSQ